MLYGWGAVMSRMTEDDVVAAGLQDIFPASHTLFRPDLADSVPPAAFCERLWSLRRQIGRASCRERV